MRPCSGCAVLLVTSKKLKRYKMTTILQPDNDKAIRRCYPVMSQLRPHLAQDEFVSRVKQQMQEAYRLACVVDNDDVVAVAGFRLGNNLAWGQFMYVDDLVTGKNVRSRGYGKQLLDWLVDYAKQHDCEQLHLDSGVQRYKAHKFYLMSDMAISSHHFTLKL